ncbi:hypothetical protein RFI_16415, partial [Reticulomyxa filosa]
MGYSKKPYVDVNGDDDDDVNINEKKEVDVDMDDGIGYFLINNSLQDEKLLLHVVNSVLFIKAVKEIFGGVKMKRRQSIRRYHFISRNERVTNSDSKDGDGDGDEDGDETGNWNGNAHRINKRKYVEWNNALQLLCERYSGLKVLTAVPWGCHASLAREIQQLYDHVLCIRDYIQHVSRDLPILSGTHFCQYHVHTGFLFNANSHSKSKSDSKSQLSFSSSMSLEEKSIGAQSSHLDYWSDGVSIGPEFSTLCREGVHSMVNATKYIVYCQQIDFAEFFIEPLASNPQDNSQGVNLFDILLQKHAQAHICDLEKQLE